MLKVRVKVKKVTNTKTEKPLWIPTGFKHLTGDLDTGYVVIDSLGNEFTYLPESDEYISRYGISKGENGMPMSLPNKQDWTDISYNEVKKVIANFGKDRGNYTVNLIDNWENEISKFVASKIDKKLMYKAFEKALHSIDSNVQLMAYNIAEIGNYCMTNEKKGKKIVFGGGKYFPVCERDPLTEYGSLYPDERCDTVGFRIVLRYN